MLGGTPQNNTRQSGSTLLAKAGIPRQTQDIFGNGNSVPSLGTSQKRSEVENPSDALVHFQGTTSMGFGKSQVGVT